MPPDGGENLYNRASPGDNKPTALTGVGKELPPCPLRGTFPASGGRIKRREP